MRDIEHGTNHSVCFSLDILRNSLEDVTEHLTNQGARFSHAVMRIKEMTAKDKLIDVETTSPN